ncbi:MAG: assimilatory sulfite reductase (NADPH) hemoprotein subunit [Steroidobacteraceae bacterium]
MADAPLSPVEHIKAASRGLRGTLEASLADAPTGALADDDTQLLKFHGSYQQDDRDLREERRLQKLEPAYSFMIRTRLPGGVCTPQQWLALDEIARVHGNGTLRLTTRQAFQFHGVVKRDLKATMAAINATLIDTIAACGDVNRNVIASANPVESRVHAEVYGWATRISEHLRPRTRAYYEIWLGEEKVAGTPEAEPIYGPTYLPRKFKIAIAVPPHNDIDVFAHDLGLIAILDEGPQGVQLAGFNVAVGGGLGATHGDATTYPRIAQVIGFVQPTDTLAVIEAVVTTQRDFGDRSNRKRARLKYTIETMGLKAFVAEVERRAGVRLAPAKPYRFTTNGDRFGWTEGFDGRWHLNLRIPAGRIADRDSARQLSGLRAIAEVHRGDFRLTANQNLVIAHVAAEERASIDALVLDHGLDLYTRAPPSSLNALACVALPTCPLAMAEAERYLPDFLAAFEARLAHHGLAQLPVLVRISGCPNGCSRPYLAEVALVGKAPGRYNLHLGGNATGERLNVLYRENLAEAAILEALDPLLWQFANERRPGELFGDFLWRAKLLSA